MEILNLQAELFVFVGRWSQQKGVDLIADVFPAVLKANSKVQLIAVGPVIDLYGKFAALKLEKLMNQYPGRVYSKPEFTALPSCIFSGAEFALMPSRDEPFGLVAVEFGRKGALCVGSRVGGFGHMPGWWFTVESVTSKHLISQFNGAITAALGTSYHTRALMRASSKLQRFPVSQWVEDLEKLQNSSIELSVECKNSDRRQSLIKRPSQMFHPRPKSSGGSTSRSMSTNTPPASPGYPNSAIWATASISSRPGNPRLLAIPQSLAPGSSASTSRNSSRPGSPFSVSGQSFPFLDQPPGALMARRQASSRGSSLSWSPPNSHMSRNSSRSQMTFRSPELGFLRDGVRSTSNLSLSTIATAHSDAALLQNAAPVFLDSKNSYYDDFSLKLDQAAILGKQGPGNILIEEYLVDSERDWFNKLHQATLSPRTPGNRESQGEFSELLGAGFVRPSFMRVLLQRKIGTWFIYSYLLAFVGYSSFLN